MNYSLQRFTWGAGLVLLLALGAAAVEWIGDLGGALRLEPHGHPLGKQAGKPPGGFPRTAVDTNGYELTLTAPPQRIASQALATDHLLFDIVPHERIVSVSSVAHDPRYSNIAQKVAELGLPPSTDPETILQLNPDLIFVASISRAEYVDLVRAAGAPTFRLMTIYRSLEEIKEGIRLVGYLTGEDKSAAQLIKRFSHWIEKARSRRPPGALPLRVLAYSEFSYSYGQGSLFGDMVETLGEVNVASAEGLPSYGKINTEYIIAWDPDWIVSPAEPGQEETVRQALLDHPAVSLTRAAKLGQILIVPNRQYLSMSHHAVSVMEAMAEAFYPDNQDQAGARDVAHVSDVPCRFSKATSQWGRPLACRQVSPSRFVHSLQAGKPAPMWDLHGL